MIANRPNSEIALTDQAISWLGERLPQGWSVDRSAEVVDGARDTLATQGARGGTTTDSAISLQAPNGTLAQIAVEEKQSLPPRAAMTLLSPLAKRARELGGRVPLLIVAPWLSARTQRVLAEQQINYVDLSGNALISLSNPPFYLQTQGAERNPSPQKRSRSRLTGRRAARLLRLLADVRPPYGAGELAKAAGLAPGYVSQLLDLLYREALIERVPRGPVQDVDVDGLLWRWASTYDVFKSNAAETFVTSSSEGISGVLAALSERGAEAEPATVTGSVAAGRVAPVAAPATLTAYCESPGTVARELNLLPTDEGANVVLLKPFDSVAWERSSLEDGVRYAAPSQVVVDCLTGTGRMPSEGEALLRWMQDNEDAWRLSRLPEPTGMAS